MIKNRTTYLRYTEEENGSDERIEKSSRYERRVEQRKKKKATNKQKEDTRAYRL